MEEDRYGGVYRGHNGHLRGTAPQGYSRGRESRGRGRSDRGGYRSAPKRQDSYRTDSYLHNGPQSGANFDSRTNYDRDNYDSSANFDPRADFDPRERDLYRNRGTEQPQFRDRELFHYRDRDPREHGRTVPSNHRYKPRERWSQSGRREDNRWGLHSHEPRDSLQNVHNAPYVQLHAQSHGQTQQPHHQQSQRSSFDDAARRRSVSVHPRESREREVEPKETNSCVWVHVLQIKDDKMRRKLESRSRELEAVDSQIEQLSKSRLELELIVQNLKRTAEREELNVMLTEEKLDEFTFL